MSMDMEYFRLRIQKLSEELQSIVSEDELIFDEDLDRIKTISRSIKEYVNQYEYLKRQIEEYL